KANACGGQPVAFVPPNTVTYCPPPHFHTLYGPGGTDSPVIIGFSVEDKVGNPGLPNFGTITLSITPVDDGPPIPHPINAITDYGAPLTYQLGPAGKFNNFSILGSTNGLDYPATFTYTGHDGAYAFGVGGDNQNLFAHDALSTDDVLTAAFNQATTSLT